VTKKIQRKSIVIILNTKLIHWHKCSSYYLIVSTDVYVATNNQAKCIKLHIRRTKLINAACHCIAHLVV